MTTWVLMVSVIQALPAQDPGEVRAEADLLEGTPPLEFEGDLARELVQGLRRFALQQSAEVVARRRAKLAASLADETPDSANAQRTEIEFFDGPHEIRGVGTFAFLHRWLEWPPR